MMLPLASGFAIAPWFAAIAAVLALLYLRACKLFFHVMQQSGYDLQRAYFRVIGRMGLRLTLALTFTGAAAGIVSLFFPWCGLAAGALGCGLCLLCERKAAGKTPLVCTNRIRRTAALLYALLFALCWAAGHHAAFLPLFLPVLVWTAFALMQPVEAVIRRRFLQRCSQKLNRCKTKVIGVTGSAGKTGVKRILAHMLSKKYRVLATPKSYNTPLGVARTVNEQLTSDIEYLVVEMGARHRGDILELCRLTEPVAGIVTSVFEQHMETFGTLECVTDTKFELPEYLLSGRGFCVLNGDNPAIRRRLDEMRGLAGEASAGEEPKKSGVTGSERAADGRTGEGDDRNGPARESCEPHGGETSRTEEGALCSLYAVGSQTPRPDFRLRSASCDAEGSLLTLEILGREYRVSTALLGRHQWNNILVAAYTALLLGVEAGQVVEAISELKAAPHRLEIVSRGNITVLDDSYNANPEGARCAFECLSLFEGRHVAVTPGLVEEGSRTAQLNRELGENAARYCDVAILVGRNAPYMEEGAVDYQRQTDDRKCRLICVENLKEASQTLAELIRFGDVVLFENDLPDLYEKG